MFFDRIIILSKIASCFQNWFKRNCQRNQRSKGARRRKYVLPCQSCFYDSLVNSGFYTVCVHSFGFSTSKNVFATACDLSSFPRCSFSVSQVLLEKPARNNDGSNARATHDIVYQLSSGLASLPGHACLRYCSQGRT